MPTITRQEAREKAKRMLANGVKPGWVAYVMRKRYGIRVGYTTVVGWGRH